SQCDGCGARTRPRSYGRIVREGEEVRDGPRRSRPCCLRSHGYACRNPAGTVAAEGSEREPDQRYGLHSHRCRWEEARVVITQGKGGGVRLLGHLVRSLPRPISAVSAGEAAVRVEPRRGLPWDQYRR